MKIGDRVRIKSYSELPLNKTGYHDYLFFASSMDEYCGKTVTLKRRAEKGEASSQKVWVMNEISWMWHEDWFDQLEFFTDMDKDFEI